MNGAGLDLGTVTIFVAIGAGLTFLALCVVFGGFFAERRLRDRLEDIETRALTGSRSLQMATLRRVERQGRLPTLDRLLWRWFPNASIDPPEAADLGHEHHAGRLRLHRRISIAVAVAFLLYLVLDLAPGMALGGSLLLGIGLPNVWVGWRAKKRGQKFNLLFPEAVDLIVRALRAGLPVQEAIGNVARDIKDPVGGIFQPRPAGDAARHADRGRAVARRQDRADRRVQLPDRRHVDPARYRRQPRRDAGQPQRAAARPPAAAPQDPRLHLGGAHHHADHGRPAVPGRWRPVPDLAGLHRPAVHDANPAR